MPSSNHRRRSYDLVIIAFITLRIIARTFVLSSNLKSATVEKPVRVTHFGPGFAFRLTVPCKASIEADRCGADGQKCVQVSELVEVDEERAIRKIILNAAPASVRQRNKPLKAMLKSDRVTRILCETWSI